MNSVSDLASILGDTISTLVLEATNTIGAKAVAVSYGMWAYMNWFITVGPGVPIRITLPLGGLFATSVAPLLPPAPPTFSTSTGWPIRGASFSASRREITSVVPPAANGTTMRTGWSGHACAAPEKPMRQHSATACDRRGIASSGDGRECRRDIVKPTRAEYNCSARLPALEYRLALL